MKKLLLCFFLFFALSVGYSQTNISGGIYSNTTWTASESPYIVTGNIVIFQDVTLTIEPGVIVRFDLDIGLELRGKLIAIGTSTDKITFTSNSSSPQMNDWNGIITNLTSDPFGEGDQVTMEHCIGEYAHHFINLITAHNGPYIFRNCYFNNNNKANNSDGYPSTIFEDCTFESNYTALDGGSKTRVSNSSFINNIYGVEGVGVVENCYFSGNTGIALAPYGSTTGCLIENNNIGVRCYFNAVNDTFVDNTIIDNTFGVDILSYFNEAIDFTGNTICNNTDYNIRLLTGNNADLSYNCWCSSDETEIRSSINDGYILLPETSPNKFNSIEFNEFPVCLNFSLS